MYWHLSTALQSIILAAIVTNCTTMSNVDKYDETFSTFEDASSRIIDLKPNIAFFKKRGPFKVSEIENFKIRVNGDYLINTDVYLSKHNDKAPLVIIQHGNKASKSVHRNQAIHLASWGMHVLVASLPNRGQWLRNGVIVEKLVKLLYTWPDILDRRFNKNEIILAGHSFGGSAIAIAAGRHAPVKGMVFLDPALVDNKVKKYLKQIEVPTILLGADKEVFRSRKRYNFFNLIQDDAIEVSFRGTTHNDAQSPNLFSFKQMIGLEHAPSEEKQNIFMAALTASVFSLSSTGGNTFAWDAFRPAIKEGLIINPKKK